jgi:hypothetical protein
MAGTLSVQKIQGLASSATPTVVEVSTGHTLHAPGHVIQVQQGLYTSYTSFTNTSMAASDLTVNITPKFASSKILLVASCQMGYPTQNAGVTMTFLRGSTNLASTTRPGFAHIGDSTGGNQRTYQMLLITMNFLDSPNTTSQITYSVGFQLDTGTGYFNRNRNGDAGSRGTSVITAQEIAQ